MLDVHVDAVKVTTVCVSDYDGVHTNKPHNRLWWTRGSERQAARAQLKLTQVDPPPPPQESSRRFVGFYEDIISKGSLRQVH